MPLLVLPWSDQPLLYSKSLLFFVTTLGLALLFAFKTWQQRFISFVLSPFTAPLVLMGISVLVSSFLTGNYPVEHLLGMGGILLSGIFIALFAGTVLDGEKLQKWLPSTLAITGSLIAVSTILQAFGYGWSHLLNMIYPIDFPHTGLFNLAGSSLIAAQVLGVLLIGLAGFFFSKQKMSVLEQLGTVVIAGGLLVSIWTLLPGQPAQPAFLPFTASWSVAVDTLRAPKTALIGFGPQGFQNAYSIFRPQWINQTELWSIQFSQGSNAPLTFLVTLGVLGLAAWLFFVYVAVRQTKQVSPQHRAVHWMLLATIILQICFPLTFVMLAFQALILVFWISLEANRFADLEIYGLTVRKVKNKAVAHPVTNTAQVVLYVFVGVITLSVVGISYGLGRAFLAQWYVLKALEAIQANDAVGVYNFQQQAVQLNPYSDELRRQYASTNLTIASALAQKTDQTPEEAEQFSQLVQQAIREGQAATLIDNNDSANWTNLAQIYRALIGVADDADQWAVNSYITAIQTNPQSPGLRVELGGVLYAAENYTEAAQFFQQAINLKPDFANAYYNLANALVRAGQLESAKSVYQQTLQLVPADSEDYLQAAKELEELDTLIIEQKENDEEVSPNAPSALTTDQAAESNSTTPSATTNSVIESSLDTVSQPSDEPLSL